MPHTRDFSDAVFRRAIIITFNRTFEEHERDKNLRDKLKQELPGILNLALAAFANVLRTGTFTEPKSCLRAKKEWQLNCDQAAQFVAERCELDPNKEEPSQKVYSSYTKWAQEAGIRKTLNKNSLTSRLRRLKVEPKKGTGGSRRLVGIRLGSGGK